MYFHIFYKTKLDIFKNANLPALSVGYADGGGGDQLSACSVR